MNNSSKFFDFKTVSKAEWLKKIENDLKGKPLSVLEHEIESGIQIKAIYTNEDLPSALHEIEKNQPTWGFNETFKDNQSNKEILEALTRGIDVITIPYSKNLQKQLEGVELGFVKLNILIKDGEDFAEIKGNQFFENLQNTKLIIDPINHSLETGGKIDFSDFLATNAKNGINIDLLHLQQSGSTVVQQLGAFLGSLSEYVEQSTPERLVNSFLRIGVSKNYFLEIAKIRAIRTVFQSFCEAHQTEGRLTIQAISSLSDYSQPDAKTNMLRATTQVMSAVIGGADQVGTYAYDELLDQHEKRSNRIARNIHHLLKEEAHLDAVNDASKGSYFIENLTQEIAEKGWTKFLQIEDQGGYIKALEEGWFQHEIMASANEKVQKAKSGKSTIIGVNKFLNNLEKSPKAHPPKVVDGVTPIIPLDTVNYSLSVELEKDSNHE